jgi:hypothetical protein
MADQLSAINDALVLTGNNRINTLGDGSDEDLVAGVAYQNAVDYVLASHNWNFATDWQTPTLLGEADADDNTFSHMYQVPGGTLQIVKILVNNAHIPYRIYAGKIYMSPPTSATIQILRVIDPGPENWPALFARAVRHFLMAGLYRGLNEDTAESLRMEQLGDRALSEARTRTDQNNRPGTFFVQRGRIVRATRRGY